MLTIAKGVRLDPDDAGGWTFGVLAKKGAGKTYTGRVMAEEFHKAGVPFVVLDPTGAWWGLRGGERGEGLPVIIFGGDHADVPLEPTAGKLMADLVVEQRLSMVLDISQFGTRAAERRFALDFLDRLYRRNKELVHLFVDEADLFAPQKPSAGDAPLLGVMENLVRRGRIKGIGCTLISQRSAVINKDVLTQIDVLCAMRITSPQDRAAIGLWIKGHDAADREREVLESLAGLQNGECWWWSPEIDLFVRTTVREARTFDSSPTPRRGSKPQRQPVSVANVDLDILRDKMAATIERAKADDPRELHKRIKDLERERDALMAVGGTQPPFGEEEYAQVLEDLKGAASEASDAREIIGGIEAAGETVLAERLLDQLEGARERTIDAHRYVAAAEKTIATWGTAPSAKASAAARKRAVPPLDSHRPRSQARPTPSPAPGSGAAWASRAPRPAATANGDGPQLKKGAREILAEMARVHPLRLTRSQIGLATGKKITGGTFTTYWGTLKREGLIDEDPRNAGVTEAGLELAGVDGGSPMTAEEIREMWRTKLKLGARNMLDEVVASYPNAVTREELADRLDMAVRGGTFTTYLGTLKRNGLVLVEPEGVQAHPDLFVGA